MAIVRSSQAIDITTLDLNFFVRNATGTSFQNNVFFQFGVFTFEDVLVLTGGPATGNLSLLFGGQGFTFNSDGVVVGGTVTGFGIVTSDLTEVLAIVDISAPAPVVYTAFSGPSIFSDIALVNQIFAGDDLLLLSGFADNMRSGGGNDTVWAGQGDDRINGESGGDILVGEDGNDTLDGGTGVDLLFGGKGNDVYTVDSLGDIVFEDPGEGIDRVNATSSFYLYDNIEVLSLEESAGAAFGVGNDLNNVIFGNDFVNLLLGGLGSDEISGFGGNDVIFSEAGNDTIFGDNGVDFLAGGFGNDSLLGGANPDEIFGEEGDDTLDGGSSFDTDILVGGSGNDVIRGNSGQGDFDLMNGGVGNDTYFVDTPADLTFEGAGEGRDVVVANIVGAGYYLYPFVEDLVLQGSTPFGVGNELANLLVGSATGNFLLGGAGNDTIEGGGGNDVLFGESGADVFFFSSGTGADVIGDFLPGFDRIDLTGYRFGSFAAVQARMFQVGDTTGIDLGNGDLIVINGIGNAQLAASSFII